MEEKSVKAALAENPQPSQMKPKTVMITAGMADPKADVIASDEPAGPGCGMSDGSFIIVESNDHGC